MPRETQVPEPSLDYAKLIERAEEELSEWNPDRIRDAVKEYSRFLMIHKAFPEETIFPPPDVDQIWHLHILDTLAYADDCARYFGSFLHHNPCFDRGQKENERIATTTCRLYAELFGPLSVELERTLDRIRFRGETCR
jgi:hypothetical protein